MQFLKLVFLTIISVVFLVACSENSPETIIEEAKAEEVEQKEDDLNEAESATDEVDKEIVEEEVIDEEYVELDSEEIHEIILQNLSEMNERMSDFALNEYEAYFPDFAHDLDDFGEDYQAALVKTEELIGHLFTKDAFNYWGEHFTRAYACSCDSYPVIMDLDARSLVEVIEQSHNHFIATTLSYPYYHSYIAKHKWHYTLEDGEWKLQEHEYVNGEEEPYHLTYEQIEEAYGGDFIVEFVEETELEGEAHIVVKIIDYEEYYFAYNVNTGEAHFLDEYNANDE